MLSITNRIFSQKLKSLNVIIAKIFFLNKNYIIFSPNNFTLLAALSTLNFDDNIQNENDIKDEYFTFSHETSHAEDNAEIQKQSSFNLCRINEFVS